MYGLSLPVKYTTRNLDLVDIAFCQILHVLIGPPSGWQLNKFGCTCFYIGGPTGNLQRQDSCRMNKM